MKRIVDFYLPKMSQQQSFLFFQQVYNLMVEITDPNLQPRLRTFLESIRRYDAALKAVPNGQLAEKLTYENGNRKRALALIRKQAAALSDDSRKLKAKIEEMLYAYDEASPQTDEEKTVLLGKFIAELEPLASDKKETEMTDSLSLLKLSNMSYKQYAEAYKMELTGKCVTSETLRTRKETERIYESVVEFINAILIYFGDREYADLIDRINSLIYSDGIGEPEMQQAAVYA